MSQDLNTLEESASGDNAPAMLAVLHRIRGGLSAVALKDLLAQAESLENQIRSNGQTPASREMLTLLVGHARNPGHRQKQHFRLEGTRRPAGQRQQSTRLKRLRSALSHTTPIPDVTTPPPAVVRGPAP
jgi:two-component system capsular synthesis sensor histidine kinase RcsC